MSTTLDDGQCPTLSIPQLGERYSRNLGLLR